MLPPDAAAKESLGGVTRTAFLASASKQLGNIANTRASSSTTPRSAPGRVPFQAVRQTDEPGAAGMVRGRPGKQQGKALRLAEAPPGLLGLLPAAARPPRSRWSEAGAAARGTRTRAQGTRSAPRPLRRSLVNPAPMPPPEAQRKGNSRSPSRRPGFWERQSNGSTYGGPGAQGSLAVGWGRPRGFPAVRCPLVAAWGSQRALLPSRPRPSTSRGPGARGYKAG